MAEQVTDLCLLKQHKSLLRGWSTPPSKPTASILECDEDLIKPMHPPAYVSTPRSGWSPSQPDYQLKLRQVTALVDSPLGKTQDNLTPSMRAILLDWMLEVSSEFNLKRETYYLGVAYLDLALSRLPHILPDEFQLVGLEALQLAAKMEEVSPPHVLDWKRSADNGFSVSQITEFECKLLKSLNWSTIIVTPFNCVSWLMNQWDSFLEYNYGLVPHNKPTDFHRSDRRERQLFEQRMIYFKKTYSRSYKRFREAMQILDTASLVWEFNKFAPSHLAAAVLYLVVCKGFYLSNYALLYYNGPDRPLSCPQWKGEYISNGDIPSDFNLESAAAVEEMYEEFVQAALGITRIQDIHKAVYFLHPFLDIAFNYQPPTACKLVNKKRLQSHYEEFLCYQTYSPGSLAFATSYINSHKVT